MKNFLIKNLGIIACTVTLFTSPISTFANNINNDEKVILQNTDVISTTYYNNGYSKELASKDINIKRWFIMEDGVSHYLELNTTTNIASLDNEEFKVEIFETPINARTTVDSSTGTYVSSKVPYKGSAIAAATLLGAAIGGWEVGSIANMIAGVVTADLDNIYYSYRQYQSKEIYYSSYYNTNYRKVINKEISLYTNSISSSNRFYGPADGGWFDPIRPY